MIDPTLKAQVPNELLWQELVDLGEVYDVRLLGREQGTYGIVLKDFALPSGVYRLAAAPGQTPEELKTDTVDLLMRIPEQYPHAQPDMFWVRPFVTLASGVQPGAASQFEDYYQRRWQRFSWHLSPGCTWRPLADTLRDTFVPFIERRLRQGS